MKEYPVRIRETLELTVTVEAANPAQAREIVERNWKNSEYVLDADHFSGVTFSVPSRSERER
jgi:hypothetical protein